MKQYSYISPQDINRLAFRAYFNKLKPDASGIKLLGKQKFYEEAARYLLNIEKAKHRIEHSSIRNGFSHIEEKLSHEYEAVVFKAGVIEAKRELTEFLARSNSLENSDNSLTKK